MRLAFVIENLRIHGSVRRLVGYANGLIARGHSVLVATPEGLPCDWLPLKAPVVDLRKLSLKRNLDALIAFGCSSEPMHLSMAACGARLKVLFLLGVDERQLDAVGAQIRGEKSARGPIVRAIKEALLGGGKWALAVNSTWQHDWLKEFGVETEILFGGIDMDIFHPVKVTQKVWPTVISSGAIREREGSVEVARACEIMRGRGGYPDLVLSTYDKKGYPQEKMAEVYCGAHIAMDGQKYAGWNNFVAEAMACGVPVVCTDIGGNRDLAYGGATALRVPPGDAGALAEAGLLLLGDVKLRAKLAAAALIHVRQFTWGRALDRMEAFLSGTAVMRLEGGRG